MLIALSASVRQFVDLVVVDNHILSFGMFVAVDDLVVRDLSVDRADLLIANPAVAGGVQLVKMNLAPAAKRRLNRLHRHRNQTQPQETLPARTECHGCVLSDAGGNWRTTELGCVPMPAADWHASKPCASTCRPDAFLTDMGARPNPLSPGRHLSTAR